MTKIAIPETITVHLGPPNEEAQNVVVSFPDYIKSVASSEIYPTWPTNAIKANILAQISFALNRIYTEHYRTRGYDFEITSSPDFDQAYIHNRNVFDNIDTLVDEIFNDYAVKEGELIPFFTQYCDGKKSDCPGLKQWGTVDLSNKGLTPLEILQFYYGNEINIVNDAPVQNIPASYPGVPLELGSSGVNVQIIQTMLNRITQNYPGINKIPSNSFGFYGVSTQNAVKTFQKVFNLTSDGIVGKATWYKIMYVYVAVKKLAELDSEGLDIVDVNATYDSIIEEGESGNSVEAIQYYLNFISLLNNNVLPTAIDGDFGPSTKASVESFQKAYNLPVTGKVDEETYNKIIEVYSTNIDSLPPSTEKEFGKPYPGEELKFGSENENVKLMQEYLSVISTVYPGITPVNNTGYYGPLTQQTVIEFQEEFGILPSGVIGPVTWGKIIEVYTDVIQ